MTRQRGQAGRGADGSALDIHRLLIPSDDADLRVTVEEFDLTR